MKRSLKQMVRTNWPTNAQRAFYWLIWTIGSIFVSIAISCTVDYLKNHTFSLAQSITHGELFAFSASLVIGSGRLIARDEDLEDFVGRQLFGVFALISVACSELLFFLCKADGGQHPLLASFSLWTALVAVVFVWVVVFIDASRIPRPDIARAKEHDIEDLMKSVERGL